MRPMKPDPYDGFKSDRERRRALNTRARCYAFALVAMALGPKPMLSAGVTWLIRLFH